MKVIVLDADRADDAGTRLVESLTAGGAVVEILDDPVVAARVAQEDLSDALVVCVPAIADTVIAWCRRLRENDAGIALFVVADSAPPEAIVAVLDAGADDCVTRPVRLSEILARLRAVERRGHRPRPVLLSHAGLTLDPAAHRAWRGETELDLSVTEFALLAALLRRPGEALTRAELLDLVWNRTPDDASNLVDQVVARLRRDVDEPFGTESIETVRGVGYRLAISGDSGPSASPEIA